MQLTLYRYIVLSYKLQCANRYTEPGARLQEEIIKISCQKLEILSLCNTYPVKIIFKKNCTRSSSNCTQGTSSQILSASQASSVPAGRCGFRAAPPVWFGAGGAPPSCQQSQYSDSNRSAIWRWQAICSRTKF